MTGYLVALTIWVAPRLVRTVNPSRFRLASTKPMTRSLGSSRIATTPRAAPETMFASVTGKIRVEEVEEAFLPVTLDEVHGKKATLRDADGATYTVAVGDVLKGMSYRVVDVEARSVNDKDGNVVDASVVKLRHERTGQTISLIKGIPTREHGAYAVLVVNSTGQKIKVELDHDFSLPDEPGQTYRILDIRPTQVVIKRMRDGEVWTLQKTSG